MLELVRACVPRPVFCFSSLLVLLHLSLIKKEPSHLHIMLSGTCTVTKYPDRLAAVQRNINEIGAALYRINSKYTYHREVRTKIVSARYLHLYYTGYNM